MKHATAAALDRLEPLLTSLRKLPGLKEKSRGVFYRKSVSFLHFHEDPRGLFADIRRPDGDFDRHRSETDDERAAFFGIAQTTCELLTECRASQTLNAGAPASRRLL